MFTFLIMVIFIGSMGRGNFKHGKKQFVYDDNRRSTYFHSHPSVTGREPSVLTTFEGERKQLMPVSVYLISICKLKKRGI